MAEAGPNIAGRDVKPMIAHESGFIGQAGINLIATIVNEMRHPWTPTPQQADLGVDGYIELCADTPDGQRHGTGFIIKVQSKATNGPWPQENDDGFVFHDITERALQYWLASSDPIILVVSRPRTAEAYWISVKHYFQSIESRRSRSVIFRKAQHRFDASIDLKMRDLAVPPDANVLADPLRKMEAVMSNLLPVLRFPALIYAAGSRYKRFASIQRKARKAETRLLRGWFLKKNRIFSFRPLDVGLWPTIIKGKIETIAAKDWAHSADPDVQRDFVRLLNEGLASYLGGRGLWHLKLPHGQSLYYFAPAENGIERRAKWGERGAERAVVQAIHAKKDPDRILCYRHTALIPHFECYGDTWYLAIEPTYHFTRDGEQAYAYRKEYLAGIKRFEKHLAVSSNVRFLGDLLTYVDLLEKRDDLLAFAKPLQFPCDFGISDADWLSRADPEEALAVAPGGDVSDGDQATFDYET